MTALDSAESVGVLLRQWRLRRRLSQLDLATASGISTRHLSFIETGRSRPTNTMIVRLAEHLDVPLRERNALLLAGGYAPVYPRRELAGPDLGAVLAAFRQLLDAHRPYPALLVNRWWELIESNAGIDMFTVDVAPQLLEPPLNVLRLCLHPNGMAPRIANLAECKGRLLARLRRQADLSGDHRLVELHRELRSYPGGDAVVRPTGADVVVPLRYRHHGRELAFFSVTSTVGSPLDVTVAELAMESFFPA
ncbi:MAG: helix-turn-helix domain-containing protein, partial [Sciscionella sp.]|nr:helix-turn-helix domain-containing protein [Sciscionella sp.]